MRLQSLIVVAALFVGVPAGAQQKAVAAKPHIGPHNKQEYAVDDVAKAILLGAGEAMKAHSGDAQADVILGAAFVVAIKRADLASPGLAKSIAAILAAGNGGK